MSELWAIELFGADRKMKTAASIRMEAIRAALAYYGGNHTKAAKALKIGRSTMYRLLEKEP